MKKNHMRSCRTLCGMSLLFFILMTAGGAWAGTEITGCANNAKKQYNGYFDPGDFEFDDVQPGDSNKGLNLLTGKDAINPNSIIIPKEQEVFATYFFEGAGYQSDFGWFLYSDAVDNNETPEDKSDDTFIGWDALLKKDQDLRAAGKDGVLHPIFIKINDDKKDSTWESDNNSKGVFDKASYGTGGDFPVDNEAKIADISQYNDGSDIPFLVNNDGVVTPLDMKKSLGNGARFAPDTEIVFFLAANHRWNDKNKSSSTFFTKTDWNPDHQVMKWKFRLYRENCANNDKRCAEIFECFDDARDMDCFDDCANDDMDCIKGCYKDDAVAACKSAIKTCFETDGCDFEPWYITDRRMVPQDKEIAASATDPGWLDFDRTDYTYKSGKSVSHSIRNKNHSKYPGLVYDLQLEEVKFDPMDPPSPLVGPAKFNRRFKLGVSGGESWKTDNGWLASDAVNRMNNIFGVFLDADDTRIITFTNGEKYPHVIVGAPKDDPTQWVLGWDDQPGTGWTDQDFNDMVFRIELEVMGVAKLKETKAIVPPETLTGEQPNYTAVSVRVKDFMPDDCGYGATKIDYYVALDGGVNDDSWIKVEWDAVYEYNPNNERVGNKIENWETGNPEYTFREGRVDLADMGVTGNQLVWKAEMSSKNETCVPAIIDVEIEGDVAINAYFSRSSPTVRTNVVYSGTYETPDSSWEDKYMRGHVVATRIYDPADPGERDEHGNAGESKTDRNYLWDAGVQLNAQEPSARKIYYPDISYHIVTDEDAGKVTFTSTQTYEGEKLDNTVIQAGSVIITDGNEVFTDSHTNQLVGDKGGSGWINRFTGDFKLTFGEESTPGNEVKASYKYYEMKQALKSFDTTNVNTTMLNLTNEYIITDSGKIYTDDLDGDGVFDVTKDKNFLVNWTLGYKDGSSTKKPWILGAVDHSTPALAHAPGKAAWYDNLDDTEKTAYQKFMKDNINRLSLLLVGSRDGMLHAFNAGHFRWYSDTDDVTKDESGNNPKTPFQEYRGYFEWDGDSDLANKDHTYGSGNEEWAFIPANLLPRLKNNFRKSGSQAYVDASPAVVDVYVGGAWKSLVLSALGNGGDTIFCLDITSPLSPKFMWEFQDPDLYRSKSSPAVAQVGKVLLNGASKWVTFFVSGAPTMCSNDADDEYCYPSVFMIDMADGRVIKRIFLDSESEGMGGVPSGQPAIMDLDGNGFADAMYVGSNKGFMYKITLPDESGSVADIDDCAINDKVLPIYASPAIVKNEDKTVDIFFGTSDNPYENGDMPPNTIYSFYVYRDKAAKGTCAKAEEIWKLNMPAGHRIFASAFAAAGKVYFGTSTQDTEDPCSPSQASGEGEKKGRLYMLDIGSKTEDYVEVGNIRSTPMVDDGHLYYKTMDGDASGAEGDLNSIGDGIYNDKPSELQIDGALSPQVKWWREVTKKADLE